MKLALALVVLAGCATAAPRASVESDGDVTSASVDGIVVLVRRVPGASLVAASIFIAGGAHNWGQEDAGVERLALATAVGGGPAGMTREAFVRRLEEVGSNLRAESSESFAELRCQSLVASWPEAFRLMTEAFLHPRLDPDEIELRRAQQLGELEEEQRDPERRLHFVARAALFQGHLYQNRAIGTAESVARLGRDRLIAHLARLRQRSRLMVVVAGDVAAADVIAEVKRGLGTLPAGRRGEQSPPPLPARPARVIRTEGANATASLVSVFPAPGWRDPSLPAAVLAMQLLSSRLYQEVRVKRSLSYAAGAFLAADSFLPVGGLEATSSDPDTTLKVMMEEVERLRREPPGAEELEDARGTFLTGYLLGVESTAGMVADLAGAQIYGGDWRLARRWPERLRQVTPGEVQAFALAHLGNFLTVVEGRQRGR
jgi:zinc protease